MSLYWIIAMLFAVFCILKDINDKADKGDWEIDVLNIILSFLICFVFMPFIVIVLVIGEIIRMQKNNNENKGF